MTLKTISLVLAILVLAALPASATISIFLVSQGSQQPVAPGTRVTWTLFPARSVQDTDTEAVDVVITMTVPSVLSNFTASGDRWNCSSASGRTVCGASMAAGSKFTPPLRVEFDAPATSDGGRFVVPATLATSLPNTHPSISAELVTNVYRTFAVTTADDFGAGSLRDAIAHANDRCDFTVACLVTFAGPMTIEPQSPLPAVTACNITIDGGIALNTSQDVPRPVEISGAKAGVANGLEIRSGCGVTVRGLTVNNFAGNGILMTGPVRSDLPVQWMLSVEGCFLGTDTNAGEARPNALRGIAVESPTASLLIRNSTISGNQRSGVAVWAGSRSEIDSCRIGVGRDGRALGNGASGILINGGSALILSTVANNRDFGVAVGPDAQHVAVGLDALFANGVQDFDWGLNGPTHTDPAGRMPPAPVLIDAIFDPAKNVTVVRGILPAEGRHIGLQLQRYSVFLFERSGGRYLGRSGPVNFSATERGDLPFTMNVPGDLRNRVLAGQTTYTLDLQEVDKTDSSEIGESIVGR
jgi:hypothetical protein